MTSPLSFLGPAIELIGTNASVLPATGGAFEDMARPDVEEATRPEHVVKSGLRPG